MDNNGYCYKWDPENHLVAISKNQAADPNQPIMVAEMVYDALGRRIRQVRYDNGAFVRQSDYYYDGWRVLTEVVTDAGLDISTVHYAYGNALDEVLFYVTDDGTNKTYSYLIHDHLGSPIARLNSAGTVLERYEYDAYGKRSVFNASYSQQLASNTGTNIGFTGQRVEYLDGGSLELCYYKNRWYSPGMGRMLSEDPAGYVDGVNLYEYVRSNPVNKSDIFGFMTIDDPMVAWYVYGFGSGGTHQLGQQLLKEVKKTGIYKKLEQDVLNDISSNGFPECNKTSFFGNKFQGRQFNGTHDYGGNIHLATTVGSFDLEVEYSCSGKAGAAGADYWCNFHKDSCYCKSSLNCTITWKFSDRYKFRDTYREERDNGDWTGYAGWIANSLFDFAASSMSILKGDMTPNEFDFKNTWTDEKVFEKCINSNIKPIPFVRA